MHRIGVMVVMVVVLLAGLAAARGARAGETPCPGGLPRVGHLGFEQIDCNCTVRMDMKTGLSRWTFRAEPVVRRVESDGPAAGALREGDVIAAIDGVLITTADGGRRFGQVRPGQTVQLTVRRNGRDQQVRVVAGAVCADQALGNMTPMMFPGFATWTGTPAPAATPPAPATPGTPRVPETPATPAPEAPMPPMPMIARAAPVPLVPETLPRGWTGVALSCQQCGGELAGDATVPSWSFSSPPEIYFVDPMSPAARAGLRRGDVLTHIDGVALTTEDGGRRFGAIRPGQSVRWTYRRGGTSQSVTVVAAARPEDRSVPVAELMSRLRDAQARGELDRMSADVERLEAELSRLSSVRDAQAATGRRLRYAGSVGGSEVEVRGLGNVVVDESSDEVVITTRDATIRIKRAGKSTLTKVTPKK